jgi:hypothetical protein
MNVPSEKIDGRQRARALDVAVNVIALMLEPLDPPCIKQSQALNTATSNSRDCHSAAAVKQSTCGNRCFAHEH